LSILLLPREERFAILIIKFTGATFVSPTGKYATKLFSSDGKVVEPGEFDQEVDLGGGFAFPAFRDGHAHPLFAGREAAGPVVTKAKSIAEIQQIVKGYKDQNPKAKWIEGGAYDRSIVDTGRFLASWLDEVVSDVPVVLHASDHHTIWVNSKALELIGKTVPKLDSGSVDLDDKGTPTGVLREPEAMALVLDKAPSKSLAEEVSALVWADRQLASLGIVEAQDAWITPGMTEVYLEAAKENQLLLDYNLAFKIEPASWQESVNFAKADRSKVQALGLGSLTANTVKFFADGVFGSGTAAVLDPYLDDSESFGEPLWPEDQLKAACLLSAELSFQLHIHAIGDAGVRQALDAIEYVQEKLGKPRLPNVIAHAELISAKDLPRFAKLGVIANMQPLWAQADGMLLSCQPRLGKIRLDSMYKMRDLLDSGATISFGSDWPVSSPNPLLGIATAISRTTEAGEPSGGWVIEQAMKKSEALASYSSMVQYQLTGQNSHPLAVSEPADFVVLDTDISLARALEIRKTAVLGTYKAGKRIY